MPAFPMLRRKADFEAIARLGRSRSDRLLQLRTLRTDRGDTRIGISTPRAVGGAVDRNRLRRRLRELMRERYAALPPGWDLLLIVRPEAKRATYEELRQTLGVLLERAEIGS
jgi:ribonuclease P protein component